MDFGYSFTLPGDEDDGDDEQLETSSPWCAGSINMIDTLTGIVSGGGGAVFAGGIEERLS